MQRQWCRHYRGLMHHLDCRMMFQKLWLKVLQGSLCPPSLVGQEWVLLFSHFNAGIIEHLCEALDTCSHTSHSCIYSLRVKNRLVLVNKHLNTTGWVSTGWINSIKCCRLQPHTCRIITQYMDKIKAKCTIETALQCPASVAPGAVVKTSSNRGLQFTNTLGYTVDAVFW